MTTTLRLDHVPDDWVIEQGSEIIARGQPPVIEVELEPGKYIVTSNIRIEMEIMEDGEYSTAKWRSLPITDLVPLSDIHADVPEGNENEVLFRCGPPESERLQ